MSVTPVKIGGAGSTTSAQTSIVSALTAGASIGDVVVFIANIGSGKTGSTPTDTKSNTWNLIAQPTSGTTCSCNVWYSVLTTALTTSDTITTTWSGSVARRAWTVFKVTGLTATPFDISATATGTGTSVSLTTSPTSTAQADELVCCALGWDETASTTNSTMSADAGYTLLDQELAGGGGTNQIGCGVEYKETSSTGVQTGAPTMNETCAGIAGVIFAFKVASTTVNMTATDALTAFGGSVSAVGVTIAMTATDALTAFRGSATATVTINMTATDALTAFRGSASMTSGTFLTATDALTTFRGSVSSVGVTIAMTAADSLTHFGGSAVIVSVPPYTPSTYATPWEAYLCDRFGYPIQNISRVCFGKQYTAALNQPAAFTFWSPSNDPKISGLHTDGNPYLMEGRAIRVYRNGTLVFTGHLWQVEDDGDGESVKTAVTCLDPLQWLSRRVARNMEYFSNGVGSPTIKQFVSSFNTGWDQTYTFGSLDGTSGNNPQVIGTEIARGMLNATNDYDGFTGLDDFYLSSIYRPNNATPASCTNQNAPTAPAVAVNFANSKVSDALATLVGQSGSFDIEVVPTDSDFYSSPNGTGSITIGATFQQAYIFGSSTDWTSIRGSLLTKPWKTLALLKFWAPIRGSTQSNVIFGFQKYPHNVAQISYLTDLTDLTNLSTMMGGAATQRATNTTSAQTYGVGMDVESLSDITDPTLLQALATEEAALGGNAKRTLSITPMGGPRTPLPFDSFNLGDTITVQAGTQLRGGFSGTQRIYGYTLDIADDHTTEKLTNLVTSPQTG